MTLILTCLARRFVIQVSDRRLVFVRPGGRYDLAEDDENKALLIDRSLIFAYTGWARIEGEEGARWLAKVFKPFVDRGELREGMHEVARRASEFFARQRDPAERKLHTFVGAGWKQRRRDNSVYPAVFRITNVYDDSHRRLAGARSDFIVQVGRSCRLSGPSVSSDGAAVDSATLTRITRALRRTHFLDSSFNTARFLVQELRKIARALGPQGPVGQNLMVTCLPRDAVRNSDPVYLGPPNDSTPSTFYVPAVLTEWTSRSPVVIQRGFPIYLSDVGLRLVPPPVVDPYADWR